MALFVSRFLHLPHSLKVLLLLFQIILIVSIANSPHIPAGSSVVWGTVVTSLVVNLILSLILLFEFETRIFPIKIFTYGSIERGISVTLATFYFIITWLIFGEAQLTKGGWFTAATLLSLALSMTYLMNATIFFRQWLREQREHRKIRLIFSKNSFRIGGESLRGLLTNLIRIKMTRFCWFLIGGRAIDSAHLQHTTMALAISRFAKLPQSLKVVALLLEILLIVALLKSPTLPAGSSLVWFILALSIFLDVAFGSFILFELEETFFPVHMVTYASAESGISLMLSIFYFMSMWLIIGGGELAVGGWFTTAAILCFLLAVVYIVNFVSFLRRWIAEQRQTRQNANIYDDYGSYGAP